MATTRGDDTRLDELPEMAESLEQPGYDASFLRTVPAAEDQRAVKQLLKWVRCALSPRH